MEIIDFNNLFRKYKGPFISFAKSYVRDEMVAEDIYMESMFQYWEKRDGLPEDTNVPAYVLTTIKNKSLNYLRHQLIESKTLDNMNTLGQRELSMNIFSLEACDPAEMFVGDIQKIISESLDTLSGNTKEIFYLSRFSHFTNKEIAQKFRMTEKGVEYHMSRALKVLRTALRDYLPAITILLFLLLL